MDKIILNGCRFYGYHGAFAEEQTLGQIFVVDLELAVDLTKASQSDNLEDTVHYGLVFEAVQRQVENEKYILIERLLVRFVRIYLNSFHLFKQSLYESLKKIHLLMGIIRVLVSNWSVADDKSLFEFGI